MLALCFGSHTEVDAIHDARRAMSAMPDRDAPLADGRAAR
jgi:hypothetical protein